MLQANFKVADLEKKPAKKSPAAPFTTSTLQQEASRKLYFSVSKTMTMAQRLYEAGLITYMRTDSVNLSDEATKRSTKQKLKMLLVQNIVNQEIIKEKQKELKRRMRLFVLQIFQHILLISIEIKHACTI